MSVPSSLRGSGEPRPSAVVLAVQLSGVTDEAFQASIVELERLAHTLGLDVIGRVTQKRAGLSSGAVVGAGKLKQLAAFTGGSGVVPAYAPPGKGARNDPEADETDAEGEPEDASEAGPGSKLRASVVLVDHDLTPGQARNLERATGVEVLDRSMVIVSIFQRHARTREARMQVEIARLNYLAPRMREAGAGADRQRGGIGGKGAGESAIELDRRRIRDRIAELREKLELVKRESDARRSRRVALANTVALVGYTNAGKSSLMRALTGDEVYVADQLFATLDTTVRVLAPETRPRILVSDTVGFIKKLPHDLVASFRSTLEEAGDADLLLHVVDGSDAAFRDQYDVTRSVLSDIGAGDAPSLLIINKADRLATSERDALAERYPDAVIMSARSAQDIERLHGRIVSFFESLMQEAEFVIPYADQRHVAQLHERCRVLAERYEEDGTHVRVLAPPAVLGALRRDLSQPESSEPQA